MAMMAECDCFQLTLKNVMYSIIDRMNHFWITFIQLNEYEHYYYLFTISFEI